MADIFVVLIILIAAYIGSKRGLMRSLVGIASTVASLVLSVLLYHPVSNILRNSEFGIKITESVEKYFENNPPVKEPQGILSILMGTTDAISEGASQIASMLLISAISFILVAVFSKLIIKIAILILDLGAKLPIIKQANSLLGAAVGALSGFIICYVCVGIIAALEPSGTVLALSEMIKESNIACLFYYDNLITNIMATFIK